MGGPELPHPRLIHIKFRVDLDVSYLHVIQAEHKCTLKIPKTVWTERELNPRPLPCQGSDLPLIYRPLLPYYVDRDHIIRVLTPNPLIPPWRGQKTGKTPVPAHHPSPDAPGCRHFPVQEKYDTAGLPISSGKASAGITRSTGAVNLFPPGRLTSKNVVRRSVYRGGSLDARDHRGHEPPLRRSPSA